MKKTQFYLLVLILFAALPACGTDGNSPDDEDSGEFVVPFEMFIPVNQLPNGTYSITNGRFIATFKARANVNQYELRVVRQDASKGEPFVYSFQQLYGSPGEDLRYFVVIGSSITYTGVNEAEKDQIVEKIQEELNENKHLYHSLEVKPL